MEQNHLHMEQSQLYMEQWQLHMEQNHLYMEQKQLYMEQNHLHMEQKGTRKEKGTGEKIPSKKGHILKSGLDLFFSMGYL